MNPFGRANEFRPGRASLPGPCRIRQRRTSFVPLSTPGKSAERFSRTSGVLRVAREEGLLLGISAAGNIVAARRLGERLVADGRSGVIVTIARDGAARYLNEGFWNDPD